MQLSMTQEGSSGKSPKVAVLSLVCVSELGKRLYFQPSTLAFSLVLDICVCVCDSVFSSLTLPGRYGG